LTIDSIKPHTHKAFFVKDLQNISIVGLGLLGGSVSLAVRQFMSRAIVTGFSHRSVTRKKARDLAITNRVADSLAEAVSDADLVVLATPIFTFEEYFAELAETIPGGCIVTDVGSTKAFPHRWAQERLGNCGRYVGSHPVAGSEQRGLEFARDDLFVGSRCILTTTAQTDRMAVRALKAFWAQLGCSVRTMSPADHDRIFANISHLPHLIATGLVNASDPSDMKFAGPGFLDSTRIASGPASIWTDVVLANGGNIIKGIDRVLAELSSFKKAIKTEDRNEIDLLLGAARKKRASLVKYKLKSKELLS
jgi:prephenate dehydrogenase